MLFIQNPFMLKGLLAATYYCYPKCQLQNTKFRGKKGDLGLSNVSLLGNMVGLEMLELGHCFQISHLSALCYVPPHSICVLWLL